MIILTSNTNRISVDSDKMGARFKIFNVLEPKGDLMLFFAENR
jgi:hypothetical protein